MADDRDPEEKFKAFEDALTEALHAVGSSTGRYRAHGYAKDVTSALRELLTPPEAPVAGQQVEPGDEFLRAHCACARADLRAAMSSSNAAMSMCAPACRAEFRRPLSSSSVSNFDMQKLSASSHQCTSVGSQCGCPHCPISAMLQRARNGHTV